MRDRGVLVAVKTGECSLTDTFLSSMEPKWQPWRIWRFPIHGDSPILIFLVCSTTKTILIFLGFSIYDPPPGWLPPQHPPLHQALRLLQLPRQQLQLCSQLPRPQQLRCRCRRRCRQCGLMRGRPTERTWRWARNRVGSFWATNGMFIQSQGSCIRFHQIGGTIQCEAPVRYVCWFRFAPVTIGINTYKYHKPKLLELVHPNYKWIDPLLIPCKSLGL